MILTTYFNKSYMNVFYVCLSQNISLYYTHGMVMQTKRCFMTRVGWRGDSKRSYHTTQNNASF